ncbi:Peptidase E [Snodgrassella alvi SCGC AB-598-O02]|nr:Type 1 glutamine amidotransferase-like domain-containing protein [Snodgrassella alvi]KES10924.1 Peptidase E [Snodgrassella alvi SCGC AB-598-O02]
MKTLFLTSYLAGTIEKLVNLLQKEQSGEKNILFIPTAGNVEEYTGYIDEGQAALQQYGFKLDVLDIANTDLQQCHTVFLNATIICLSGGNTFYLLQELKRKKLDQLLVQKIAQGCFYIGESAGAMILAANIEYNKIMDDSSLASELNNYTALNIIDFYPLPHYIEEPFVESVQQTYAKYKNNLPLVPINNQQAIIVRDNTYSIV